MVVVVAVFFFGILLFFSSHRVSCWRSIRRAGGVARREDLGIKDGVESRPSLCSGAMEHYSSHRFRRVFMHPTINREFVFCHS